MSDNEWTELYVSSDDGKDWAINPDNGRFSFVIPTPEPDKLLPLARLDAEVEAAMFSPNYGPTSISAGQIRDGDKMVDVTIVPPPNWIEPEPGDLTMIFTEDRAWRIHCDENGQWRTDPVVLCSQCTLRHVEHDGGMCEDCAADIHSQQDGWADD